ncbi:hypothetical protein [Paraburkholderia sp. C35]|uniref:hypothetical protein n=1 Tax=Paraburkholderia sp. C35 TaxID=2126993 RepID=UPI0013A5917A|nr:hypothetical protein [Paraburkholderia sp. C35]
MQKSPRMRAFFRLMRRQVSLSIVPSGLFVQFLDINRCREKRAATRLVDETKPLADLAEKEVGKHDALLSVKVVTGAVCVVLRGVLLMYSG